LGLLLGSALSMLLIFVINKQSFGWTIQFHPPAALLVAALLLIAVSTVVAAVYPARVAANLNPMDAVHTE
jgi:putative ABC transport system permease protein